MPDSLPSSQSRHEKLPQAEDAQSSKAREEHKMVQSIDQAMALFSSLESEPTELEKTRLALEEAKSIISDQQIEIAQIKSRSSLLASAQADALAQSATIIEELKQTKESLSTAHSAAEEAAQDTQRLADTIFERTNDAVLVLQDDRCIACNDNAVRMLGQERDELIGEWPRIFQTSENPDAHLATEMFHPGCETAGQSADVVETRLQREDGTSFWAEVTLCLFEAQGGIQTLIVVRDINTRKEFESELRSHHDFLKNIINAVPDPLSVRKADQTLVVANDAFCVAAGAQRGEILGRSKLYLSEPKHFALENLDDDSDTMIQGTFCDATEHRYYDHSNIERIASVKRSSFADQTTHERYVVSTLRDITDDRNREQRLQLLASVFEGASEGVAILSDDGTIREANPAFSTMTTTRSQSLTGLSFANVLPAKIAQFDQVIQSVVNGDSWSGKIVDRDGEQVVDSFWVSLSRTQDASRGETRVIALVSDITELESSQAELKRRAMYDPLTGLANRAYFREYLNDVVVALDRPATVCFLDLDDFKHVNDSAGHSVGDILLCKVGERIQKTMPDGVFVARFGGDEFALIILDELCPPDQLDVTFQALLDRISQPFQIDETRANVGMSIGLSRFPEDAQEVDSLMQAADIAMYVSKTGGKNRVRSFTAKMQDSVDLRHRVQTKLRDALREGDLSLNFQRKVDARTKKTVSHEALVRWKTADGNYIPPSEFIPIAEQTGLIGPLGNLVFEKAVRQACEWAAEGNLPSIAVNISPNQIRDARFVDTLVSTLNAAGASAEWFELEITEHAMMVNVDHAIKVTNQLKELGFRIAIDDFGTGYSSLSYLKNFRIDTLKIDISFVAEVEEDLHCQAIVQSIVSLGKGLGLSVVAEGVETEGQARLLTQFGCDVLQGYLIGRPVPADQISFSS